MNHSLFLAGLLPAITIAGAQDPAPVPDPSAELRALSDAYDEATSALYAELDKMEGPDVDKYRKYQAGLAEIDTSFQAKFDELATKHAEGAVAPKALVRVFGFTASGGAKSPECEARATRALETLLGRHIGSDALDQLAGTLAYADPKNESYETALRKIRGDSPHRLVQASALHALATRAYERGIDDEAKRAEVRKLYTELKTEFGSLGSASGKSFGKLADGTLFEIDHLQVGMPVPDMEATDETGTKFKLSDYGGKVVVLDFWGFW